MRQTGALLPLYAATSLMSALLLFSLQPMFTKMVLPLLGGSAAVWNTAMVFFQATLLAGYFYVHITTRLMGIKAQILLHLALLTVAFVALPIDMASGWTPPAEGSPILWLIALLTVSIGLPFAAVSTTAPLLQKWFSHSAHPEAADPYFLYGASNLGSLLALVSYPTVIEPLLGLDKQSWTWSAGYALLVVLIGLCALTLWRGDIPNERPEPEMPPSALVSRLDWRLRLRWLLLSFAPAGLLLGVTAHISTDVAAVPFLWVAPLALYLFSFVLVFARRPILKHNWMVHAQTLLLIALALLFDTSRLWLIFLLHLLALFVTAMVCHGALAKRRPTTHHLTEFYLWMSFGGMLGGMFSALVAPMIFDSAIEYPLILVLACLLRPSTGRKGRLQWVLDAALPVGVAVLYLNISPMAEAWTDFLRAWPGEAFVFKLSNDPDLIERAGRWIVYLTIGLILLAMSKRPVRYALGIAAVLFTGTLFQDHGQVVSRERSFFGIYSVELQEDMGTYLLMQGTTTHGAQDIDPRYRREPLTYYGRAGPLGQLFAAFEEHGRPSNIGAIGLGLGTLACYLHPGQTLTFYEIDPTVERLARDGRFFHYLEDCGDGVEVVFGDGRLMLAKAPDRSFDLLILDAYNSDAIPVHTITREALALYFEKLADGGLVMFHVSNRYLDLASVLSNLIADAKLVGRLQTYYQEDSPRYLSSSRWIVIGRTPQDLAMLEDDPRWEPLQPQPDAAPWTDNFSNVFGALDWGELPW